MTLLNARELLGLVDMSKCEDYALLGEDVLQSAKRADRYCYTHVATVLCGTKYSPGIAGANCVHIRSKFTSILGACLQNGDSGKPECNCSGLNMETLTITDPLVFCKLSSVIENGGGQVSFKHNELYDCMSLAESYNHCQIIGKALNHPKFCIDGGFQGYCNCRIQNIHDEAYAELCKSVVLPFLFSTLANTEQSVSSSTCRNADEAIHKSLQSKRVSELSILRVARRLQDALMTRSQELLDGLDSDRAFLMWKQDMEAKLRTLNSDMQNVLKFFNLSNRYTLSPFGTSYYYDPLVRSEADKGLKLLQDMGALVAELPTEMENMTALIGKIAPVLALDSKIKETLIHFKQFNSLITSGAHSTILGGRYYRPLDRMIFVRSRQLIASLQEAISRRLSSITSFLSTYVETPEDQGKERRVRAAAGELQFIAKLHESQLQWLLRNRTKQSGRAFSRSVGA
ncbi:uncharacterized protein BcabD6B2_49710 [Babesia caballi]|uniref:Uncharacterized protein n=1 Tax=Babesia caballi TaxID=5871 RepID=A0AAV4LZ91_BABCB|nr:hypothetical protein, conserved [Babesia caballi]